MVDEPKSGYWPPMGGVTLKVETKEKEKKVEEKKTIAVEIEEIARRYDPNSILMTRKRGDNYEYLLRFTTSIKESDFNKAGVEIAQLLKDKKVDATIHTEYQGKSVNIISPISFVENYEIMRATAALEGIQISSQTAPPEIKEDLNNLVKASTETLKAIEEGKVGKKDAKEWEGIASTWKKVKVKFATWLIADELESYWKMFDTLSQTVQELIKEKEADKETIKKMQEAQEEMKSKLNTIETNINERIAQLDKEIEDQKKKIEQLKKGKKKVDLNTKKIIDEKDAVIKAKDEEIKRLKKLLSSTTTVSTTFYDCGILGSTMAGKVLKFKPLLKEGAWTKLYLASQTGGMPNEISLSLSIDEERQLRKILGLQQTYTAYTFQLPQGSIKTINEQASSDLKVSVTKSDAVYLVKIERK